MHLYLLHTLLCIFSVYILCMCIFIFLQVINGLFSIAKWKWRECDSFLYGETRNRINAEGEKLFQLSENGGKEQKDNMETRKFCQALCRRL